MSSCGIMFADAWGLNTHVVPSVTHHYQVHDMTSCIAGRHGHKTLCQPYTRAVGRDMTSFRWLVVMDSERFASPIMGIVCGGLNAYCMQTSSCVPQVRLVS